MKVESQSAAANPEAVEPAFCLTCGSLRFDWVEALAAFYRHCPLRRRTWLRSKALKPKRGYVSDRAYREWLHTQPCIVHGEACGRWVEMHHVGRPRNDLRSVPLCSGLHREGPDAVHRISRRAFEQKFTVCFEDEIRRLNEEYKATSAGISADQTREQAHDTDRRIPPEYPPGTEAEVR